MSTIQPRHYLLALESYMDPNNGTVCYTYARVCARLLNLSEAFSQEYGHMEGPYDGAGVRIDVGEFNVWALNQL